jgi:hypothetical protein
MYFRFVKCFYLCINIIEEKYIFDITWNVYIYFYLKLYMYYKSKIICSIWRRRKQQQQLFWTPIKCRNTIKPTTSHTHTHTHTYTYIYISPGVLIFPGINLIPRGWGSVVRSLWPYYLISSPISSWGSTFCLREWM